MSRLDHFTALGRSRFTRNALTILTGTALAQVFPLLASPVLTRLYTPEDFGLFGLFYGIATMLSVVMALRYNVAVMLPAGHNAASQLVAVALLATAVLTVVALLVAVPGQAWLAERLRTPEFAPYFPWTVATASLLSVYTVGYAWMNRLSLFRRMATSRVLQAGGITGAQLAGGAAGFGATGLIGGLIAGQVLGNVLPALSSRTALREATSDEMRKQASRYSRFPMLSLPADLVNSASNQLPVLLLTSFFGTAVVGLYNLTLRVVAAPAQLLQTAVLDAYRQRAAADYAETGSCRLIFLKTGLVLGLLGLVPAALLFAFGPALFAFVFGEAWREAGMYARLLVPQFYLGFIASPLGYTLYIAEKQHIDLVWQLVLLVLVIAAVAGGAVWGGVETAILLFSSTYSAMYVVYLVLSYRVSQSETPNLA